MHTQRELRFARLCWNTADWERPTASASEAPDSFFSKQGFGHEEWLMRTDWLLHGYSGAEGDQRSYRYTHLTPCMPSRQAERGVHHDLLLYTLRPDGMRLLVGLVRDVLLIDHDEAAWAAVQFSAKGWLESMRRDLDDQAIRYDPATLDPTRPFGLANVRFRPSDLLMFPTLQAVSDDESPLWPPDRYVLGHVSEEGVAELACALVNMG